MNDTAVTVTIQTRVAAGAEDQFMAWQAKMGQVTARQPGFLDQSVVPPNPPKQSDWVILERFAELPDALAWLSSTQRLALLTEVQPLLIGADDVQVVSAGADRALPAPVAVVFSTELKEGGEPAFRIWQQKVAMEQAKAPGFQGYRFEPPILGVQDQWLAILRFDSDQNLQKWMTSPARMALLPETDSFTAKLGTRVVRTGFDQWFEQDTATGAASAAWKQNMIVVSLLYPVVFLFGTFVQTPLFIGRLHLPFWFALLLSNIVSVLLLNKLVPAVSRRFGWWLNPRPPSPRTNITGAASVALICAAWMILFFLLSRP